MTLDKAKEELQKFVKLKTTMVPSFVGTICNDNVVEVVRCKDCFYWHRDDLIRIPTGYCDEWSCFEDGIYKYTQADEFCSRGEREDGAE